MSCYVCGAIVPMHQTWCPELGKAQLAAQDQCPATDRSGGALCGEHTAGTPTTSPDPYDLLRRMDEIEKDANRSRADRAEAERDAAIAAHKERNILLFAVATKHPGETRFQTALRYINEAERRHDTAQCGQAARALANPSQD